MKCGNRWVTSRSMWTHGNWGMNGRQAGCPCWVQGLCTCELRARVNRRVRGLHGIWGLGLLHHVDQGVIDHRTVWSAQHENQLMLSIRVTWVRSDGQRSVEWARAYLEPKPCEKRKMSAHGGEYARWMFDNNTAREIRLDIYPKMMDPIPRALRISRKRISFTSYEM